jgi:hypothetical protein
LIYDLLYCREDWRLTSDVTDNLHPFHRCVDEGIKRKEFQNSFRKTLEAAAGNVDEAAVGCMSGDCLCGMVDVAQDQLVAVPHQHQSMHQFSI